MISSPTRGGQFPDLLVFEAHHLDVKDHR